MTAREEAAEKICFTVSPLPQGLKPGHFSALYGTSKLAPLPNSLRLEESFRSALSLVVKEQ